MHCISNLSKFEILFHEKLLQNSFRTLHIKRARTVLSFDEQLVCSCNFESCTNEVALTHVSTMASREMQSTSFDLNGLQTVAGCCCGV